MPNAHYASDHDACGVGFVTQLGGAASHQIVERALTALHRLAHRGGVDADGRSGDGAGLLMALPDALLRRRAREAGIRLPKRFGLGMTFLPPGQELTVCEAVERLAANHGLRCLGWREVPTDASIIGPRALATLPLIRQCFFASARSAGDLESALFRLRKEDHLLLLTMHHIVSDAWSAAVFYQEFTALYNSFVSGGTANLPELTIQYADYAYWQRQWLEGSTLDNQLRFWREQFRGVSPLLTLPTDRARPEIRTSRGGHETVAWPKELTDGLKAVSRKEGVTLFMSLLAAFQILLSRYSGQTEMMVGTDVANRPTLETERLIGFFINLLALRGSVAGNPTFRALLARVRETTLKSYAHQDFPFDKLVEELRPERNLSYNPLVQVLFVMQNTPRTIKEFAGLTVGRFDLPVKHSKFDVAVFAAETSNELLFHWIYSAELFDRTTVLRMAQHFENLVRAAVTDPEARVNALEMLTDDQKDQQSQEKQQRKQSQLKKLMIAEPKQISLSESKLGSE